MNNLLSLFLFAVSFNLCAQSSVEVPQASPKQSIEQRIGLTDIKVTYHRPQKKDRKVFGNLVPYNQIWRTGANENALFTVSTPITIEGKALETGTYALYTKPTESNWDIYFYKTTDNWGTPRSWDDKNVVLRITVPVVKLNHTVEAFTVSMDNITENSVDVGFAWEETYVSIPVKIDVDNITLASVKKALKGPSANDYYTAADYFYESGKDVKLAKIWIDEAVEMSKEKPFFLYNTKQALVYYELGLKKEAIEMSKVALEIARKAENEWGINMNKKMLEVWDK